MKVTVTKHSQDKLAKEEFVFYLHINIVKSVIALSNYRLLQRKQAKGRYSLKLAYQDIDTRHNGITAEEIQQFTYWDDIVKQAKQYLKNEIDVLQVTIR